MLLEAVVERIPPPTGSVDRPLTALIFDAHYDSFRGTIVSCRVFDGSVKIRDRYSNFISEKLNSSIKLNIEVVPLEELKGRASDSLEPIVNLDNLTGTYSIAWREFIGEYNLNTMEGNLVCEDNVNCFSSFLYFIYSLSLIEHDGLLIHACSLVNNNQGYIFPGKSGAGKTTIALLSKDCTLLSDEISLIKKINGKFIIFGTPFWGDLAISGENTESQLKGIYFHKKDNKNYLEEIKPSKILELLLPNIVFFVDNQKFTLKIFNLCMELIENIPGYKLHFLPDPSFWSCINER